MSVTGAVLRLDEGRTVSVGVLPTCSGFLASQAAVMGLCRARGPLRANDTRPHSRECKRALCGRSGQGLGPGEGSWSGAL